MRFELPRSVTRTLLTTLFLVPLTINAAKAESLLDIYQLALTNDPTLQAAEANFEAGQTFSSQALAVLLPQINGNYTRTLNDTKSSSQSSSTQFNNTTMTLEDISSPRSRSQDSDAESYSITLTQEIFNAAAFFGYRQTKAVGKQSELQFNSETAFNCFK